MLDRHAETIRLAESLAPSVLEGQGVMKKLRVTFLGTARDCSAPMQRAISWMEQVGTCLFEDWQACIYENDSIDTTRAVLEEWSDLRPQVRVVCETTGAKKWPSIRHPDRGTHLAACRNACKAAAEDLIESSDVVICLDPDLGGGFSTDGLCTTFERWPFWDAVASNGLRKDRGGWVQWDAWAFRRNTWEPRSFGKVKHFLPAPGEPWVPVLCAFGGLACYRAGAYRDGEYAGGDTEHVAFYRSMRDAGHDRVFVNPAQFQIHPNGRN